MNLIERLRQRARTAAEVSQIMADAKTARQTDRDDYPDMPVRGYAALTPEQTLEWKAADALETTLSALEEMTEHYVELVNSGDAGFWNPEDESEVRKARTAIARVRSDA